MVDLTFFFARIAAASLLCAVCCAGQSLTSMSTIAGQWTGDGGQAFDACSHDGLVSGLAWHPTDGSLLVSNSRLTVRLISANGTVDWVAGSGRYYDGVDSGPALEGMLNPVGVAWDTQNSFVIASAAHNLIRRVSGGFITTVAGGGAATNDGPAMNVQLQQPIGVAASNSDGVVFFTEEKGHRVRRLRGGILTTVIGTGSSGFTPDGLFNSNSSITKPVAIALRPSDNALLFSEGGSRIRLLLNNTIITIAGGGSGSGNLALSASFGTISGIAVAVDNTVFVADMWMMGVRRINTDGTIATVAGNRQRGFDGDGGPATTAVFRMGSYSGVVIRPADGAIAIADGNNGRVRIVKDGMVSTFAFGRNGDGGPVSRACIRTSSLAIDKIDGAIIFSESERERVRRIAPNGTVVTIAGTGQTGFNGDGPATTARLCSPEGVAVSGRDLYIADRGNHIVRLLRENVLTTLAGVAGASGFSGDGGLARNAKLASPMGVAVNGTTLFIADTGNSRIRVIRDGIINTLAGTATRGFNGDGPALLSSLNWPERVRVVGSLLLIADCDNGLIRAVDANGTMRTIVGTTIGGSSSVLQRLPAASALLLQPSDMVPSVDGSVLYFTERTTVCRLRTLQDGFVDVYAGNSACEFSGDGPADPLTLRLGYPASLDVDPVDDSLVVSDVSNSRIRKIVPIGRRMQISSAVARIQDPLCRSAVAGTITPSPACQSLVGTLHIRGVNLASACQAGVFPLGTFEQSWTSARLLSVDSCNASDIVGSYDYRSDPGPWLWQLSGSANVTTAVMRGGMPAVTSSAGAVVTLASVQPPIAAPVLAVVWNQSAPDGALRLGGFMLGAALNQAGATVLLEANGVELPARAVAYPPDSVDVRLKYAADAWFAGRCDTCDAAVNVRLLLRAPSLVVGDPAPPPTFIRVPLHAGDLLLRVPRLRPVRCDVRTLIPRQGLLLQPGFLLLPTDLWTAADVAADGVAALVGPQCHVRIGAAGASDSLTAPLPLCPSSDGSAFQMVIPAGRGRDLPLSLVLGSGLLSVPLGAISYAPTGLASVQPQGVFLPPDARMSTTSLRLRFKLAGPADDAHLYSRVRVGGVDCTAVAAADAGTAITCSVRTADISAQLALGEDSKVLPVSLEWAGVWLPAQGGDGPIAESTVRLTVVARPTVLRVAPMSAAPGTELIIFGAGFCRGDPTGDCSPASTLSILVGSAPCESVDVIADFAASCTAPLVDSINEANYPLLSVSVSNGVGSRATGAPQVLYPSSGRVVVATEHGAGSSGDVLPPPSFYLPSDATEPWLLPQPLSVQVLDALGAPFVGMVSCSLAARTVGVLVLPANRSAIDFSRVVGNGSTSFGKFLVQAPFGTGNVSVVASCAARDDASLQFFPLVMSLAPLPLSVAPCAPLPTAAQSLGPLPPIRLALLPLQSPATAASAVACTGGRLWPGLQPLPRILCTVYASPLRPETAAPILQDGSAAFNLSSGQVNFDSLRIGGEVNQAYSLTIQCAIGSIVLPEPQLATTTLLITGCAAGSQPKGSLCEPCAGDSYSDGGQQPCRKCPAVGVSCSAGLLLALPGFYRPPAHAGAPLQLTSELHECPIPSRCLINDTASLFSGAATAGSDTSFSTRTWYCAEGTTGPLCATCDEAAGYAAIGGQCLPCAPVGVNGFVVVLLVLGILAGIVGVTLLKRRAASRGDGGRSGDSIALRILLTHVQAAGSLRAFRLSGGELYRRATAWMEVLSPAILAQGPTQCAVRPSFEATFWATLSAPLLVCLLSLIVLTIAEATAAVHGRRRAVAAQIVEAQLQASSVRTPGSPTARMNGRRRARRSITEGIANSQAGKFAGIMWAVWNTGAPASILLFVLSLAYMPMLGAALSVFQCTQPIDGVRYVLADVRVRCEAGREYTTMAVAAGATLLFVGAGFPALIVWRLRRAKPVHLMSQRFRAIWSFLFEGYRGGPILPQKSAGALATANSGDVGIAAPAPSASSAVEQSGTSLGSSSGASDGSSATRNPLLRAQVKRPADVTTVNAQTTGANGEGIAVSWLFASGGSLLHWEAIVLARKASVVGLARLVSLACVTAVAQQ